MDDVNTETSADAPLVVEREPDGSPPAHLASRPVVADVDEGRPPRRWVKYAIAAPLVLVVLLVIAWVVDSSRGAVARNVELAGVDIGGLSEDELTGRVGDVADDFSTTPVELVVGDTVYETTAAEIGLRVDEDRTTESALEVGESSFLPVRPFAWALSLVRTRDAPLLFQINAEQAAATVVALEGDDRMAPTEPGVEIADGELRVVPGVDGTGLDVTEVARRLPGVAEAAVAEDRETVRLHLETGSIPPLGSQAEAAAAVAAAEELVAEPIEVRTQAGARTVSPDQLEAWVRLASTPDGTVEVTFDEARAGITLRHLFSDVEGHPVDASFTLEGGVPVIRPDLPGLVCCGDGAAAAILAARRDGANEIDLSLVEGPASFTVADAEEYGIKEPVGGNNAWRSGAPTTAAPGFTTYHDPGPLNRVTNIHRMADLVRGAVVAPGDSFSINDHVGERTPEKGFVPAGAIRDGKHVQEVGGGVSQFATTMFNAAYFAGLQIDEYQAHSEYFDRYPRGREATMGFPAPDLQFTNNTPYGILIWTSYTDTSLTITLYSTPHARGEQTAISESQVGRCAVVTTTRTITYPDGHTATDQFRATYRPGEGQRC
jgi:vancomycin resistance protein YoaR